MFPYLVPDVLLSDSEKLLISIMLQCIYLTNRNIEENQFTYTNYAELLGWTTRKVKRVVKELKEKELLLSVKLKLPNTKKQPIVELPNLIEIEKAHTLYKANTTIPLSTNLFNLFHKNIYKSDYISILQKFYTNTTAGGSIIIPFTEKKQKRPTIAKPKEDNSPPIKITKNVRLMVKYWNAQPELTTLYEFARGSRSHLQTKTYKTVVTGLKKFLSGALYNNKINIPDGFAPTDQKFTVADFCKYVDRFVQILIDRKIEPQNKRIFQNRTSLSSFLFTSYSGAPCILLKYCYKELQTVVPLTNSDAELNNIKIMWLKLNPNAVFSSRDMVELDKFVTYALKYCSTIPKFKTRSGSVIAKISGVVEASLTKGWSNEKRRGLKITYLNTNHFKGSFEAEIKRLGY